MTIQVLHTGGPREGEQDMLTDVVMPILYHFLIVEKQPPEEILNGLIGVLIGIAREYATPDVRLEILDPAADVCPYKALSELIDAFYQLVPEDREVPVIH